MHPCEEIHATISDISMFYVQHQTNNCGTLCACHIRTTYHYCEKGYFKPIMHGVHRFTFVTQATGQPAKNDGFFSVFMLFFMVI